MFGFILLAEPEIKEMFDIMTRMTYHTKNSCLV